MVGDGQLGQRGDVQWFQDHCLQGVEDIFRVAVIGLRKMADGEGLPNDFRHIGEEGVSEWTADYGGRDGGRGGEGMVNFLLLVVWLTRSNLIRCWSLPGPAKRRCFLRGVCRCVVCH